LLVDVTELASVVKSNYKIKSSESSHKYLVASTFNYNVGSFSVFSFFNSLKFSQNLA